MSQPCRFIHSYKGKDGSVIDFMALTMIDPASSWFKIVGLGSLQVQIFGRALIDCVCRCKSVIQMLLIHLNFCCFGDLMERPTGNMISDRKSLLPPQHQSVIWEFNGRLFIVEYQMGPHHKKHMMHQITKMPEHHFVNCLLLLKTDQKMAPASS